MRLLIYVGLWMIALGALGGAAFGAWELVAYKIEATRQLPNHVAR